MHDDQGPGTGVLAQPSAIGAPSRPDSFRVDIQGIRAIAVLMVVLFHGGVGALAGGYVGVDVFFVVSGFLITSHLLREIVTTGRLRLAAFYARRARRILPASFVVLGLSAVAAAVLIPPLRFRGEVPRLVAAALFAPNLQLAREGVDYLGNHTASVVQHYWSLGVEEQFYLVWPVLLLAIFVLLRRRRRAVLVATAVLVVASFGTSVWLTARSQPWAFFSPWTRAWEFGLGAVVGLGLAQPWRRGSGRITGPVLAWLGVAMVLVSGFVVKQSDAFPGWAAAVPTLGTALAIIGGARPSRWSPESLLLRWSPVQLVGRVSYSLYLVHWPLLVIASARFGSDEPLPSWVPLGLTALSFPLAWLSYRYIETPFRTRRTFTSRRPRTALSVALAASALLVAVALGAGAVVAQRIPRAAAPVTALEGTDLVPGPTGAATVPTDLTPALATSGGDVPEIYATGCHRSLTSTDTSGCWFGPVEAPTFVLFGDSHAAQWYPALKVLADAGEIRLGVFTHSGCAAAYAGTERAQSTECRAWRDGAIGVIRAAHPRAVLLGSFGNAFERDVDKMSRSVDWAQAQERTVRGLREPGTTVSVLADTPRPGEPPADCLSSHLNKAHDCDLRRAHALDSAIAEADGSLGVPVVNLDAYLCNADTCPAVIGNVLVYRDGSHLTATMAARLAPGLRVQLLPLLEHVPPSSS